MANNVPCASCINSCIVQVCDFSVCPLLQSCQSFIHSSHWRLLKVPLWSQKMGSLSSMKRAIDNAVEAHYKVTNRKLGYFSSNKCSTQQGQVNPDVSVAFAAHTNVCSVFANHNSLAEATNVYTVNHKQSHCMTCLYAWIHATYLVRALTKYGVASSAFHKGQAVYSTSWVGSCQAGVFLEAATSPLTLTRAALMQWQPCPCTDLAQTANLKHILCLRSTHWYKTITSPIQPLTLGWVDWECNVQACSSHGLSVGCNDNPTAIGGFTEYPVCDYSVQWQDAVPHLKIVSTTSLIKRHREIQLATLNNKQNVSLIQW